MTHRTRRSLFTRARIKLRHFPIHSDAGDRNVEVLVVITHRLPS